MSINTSMISGNIGRDPEMRASQSGTSILSFPVAVNERVKKGEEWTEYTNWIGVVVFGRRADSLGKILAKGMKVAVSGHLHYSSWDDKSGNKRSKLELIADDVDIMQRKEGQQNGSYVQQTQQYNNYPQQPQYAPQNGYQQPTGGYQQQYPQQMAQYPQQGNQQTDLYSTDRPF